VYAEGYYGIDSSYEAEIPQEILEEQQQVLEKGREDFENLREEINSIISNVSDIVSVVQPSGLSLVLSYQLMEMYALSDFLIMVFVMVSEAVT
ncbi:hypothetical protein CLONEX_01769, partial [[Clostridium] nexile DSM 1787]